jgi:exopolysaccharide biosynthesis WecB/TagA/CpsF family protein
MHRKLRLSGSMMNHVSNISVLTSSRDILGLEVCDFNQADALSLLSIMATMPVGQTIVSFLNANNANLMCKDKEYFSILKNHLVLPDGHGIDLASWITHGSMFPCNLNGTDLVPALMTYMTEPKRIGLIGAKPDVLLHATENFKAYTPWHEFIAVSDGYFPPHMAIDIMDHVKTLDLDILLVAMGSPLQEQWIDRYVRPEHARMVISVGALFDFMSGNIPRAPALLRKLRVEWLFRLYQEPRRLWKRYIIGNPLFLSRIIYDKFVALRLHKKKKLAQKSRGNIKPLEPLMPWRPHDVR